MSVFPSQLAALNSAVESVFGTETLLYQIKGTGSQSAFPVPSIPIDPLRLEGLTPGNFTVRWVKLDNPAFLSQTPPVNPKRGDLVQLGNGVSYVIDQVQEDTAGGARLILNKALPGAWEAGG